jgi:hypothetical protein
MFRQLTPLAAPLGALISSLVRLATTAITPLLPLLPKLMDPLVKMIASIMPPLTLLISDLTPIIGLLSQATVAFVNVALTPLEAGWSAVSRVMGPIAGAIGTISRALSNITGPISGFLGSFGGLFSKLTGGAGNASAATDGLAGSVHGLGDNANTASGMISGLNTSFDTMVGNFTGKQQSIMDTASAISQYGQDVSSAGAGSQQAQQGFLQAVSAIGQMATALQQAHTPMSVVYTDIQNQITALQNKGPLNKSETQDLQNLKAWADHLADSSQHLNFEQKSVADTMERQLIPQLVDLGVKSGTAKTDTDNLTNSIVNTGKQSDATKAARKKLIDDLEASGVNAQTATGLVDTYIKKLGKIPAKDATSILLSGKGEWSIKESNIYPTPSGKAPTPPIGVIGAQGALVRGGIPGKDSVLALVQQDELIVPTGIVRSGAVDHLRGMIPGFASGGYTGQGTSGLAKFGQSHYNTEWSGMVSTMEKDMAGAINAAIASAKAAAAASGGGPGGGGPTGAGEKANAALARSMYPSWGSGAQWTAWNSLEMGEAGWNRFAENPSSHAYGIPQALPYTKMPKPAWPASAGGQSNASDQIRWMHDYIAHTPGYGDPVHTYAKWLSRSPHWYDEGGWLKPGGIPVNGLRKPEAVLTPDESAAFIQLVKGLVASGSQRGGVSVHGSGHGTGAPVTVQYFGTQHPTPEQEAAMLLKLGSMIGVA